MIAETIFAMVTIFMLLIFAVMIPTFNNYFNQTIFNMFNETILSNEYSTYIMHQTADSLNKFNYVFLMAAIALVIWYILAMLHRKRGRTYYDMVAWRW